jgi:phage terminase large subunit-like protein
LFELITGDNLAVYPDAGMRLAISRAVAVETPRGWRIAKEKQSHKIDVVVALAMAAHAAVEGQASAPLKIHPDNLTRMRMMVPNPRYVQHRQMRSDMRLGERAQAMRMKARAMRF